MKIQFFHLKKKIRITEKISWWHTLQTQFYSWILQSTRWVPTVAFQTEASSKQYLQPATSVAPIVLPCAYCYSPGFIIWSPGKDLGIPTQGRPSVGRDRALIMSLVADTGRDNCVKPVNSYKHQWPNPVDQFFSTRLLVWVTLKSHVNGRFLSGNGRLLGGR